MQLYIVTVWESCDLGDGLCYEWQSKILVAEHDMGELDNLDVASVQLLD